MNKSSSALTSFRNAINATLIIAGLTMVNTIAKADHAAIQVNGADSGCYALLAGQTIDAGQVCFTADTTEGTLWVTYTTTGGWQLTEAHLWVGANQDGYPMAKNGNPKIGNFPYNSGSIAGDTTHIFSVPLGNVQSFIELDDLHNQCGAEGTLYAMAHAALRLVDESGNVVQTETGWSEGEGAVQRGSWATRSSMTLSVVCNDEPPPPPLANLGQETAIMFGNIVLNNDADGICDAEFAANRWGWQAGPLATGDYRNAIWAAAGKNVLENGTEVGYVEISVTAGKVTVTPVLFEGFTAEETHIYIGTAPVCSGAFGKDWKSNASTDIDTTSGVYVGVHQSVTAECGINAESPNNFCEANQ